VTSSSPRAPSRLRCTVHAVHGPVPRRSKTPTGGHASCRQVLSADPVLVSLLCFSRTCPRHLAHPSLPIATEKPRLLGERHHVRQGGPSAAPRDRPSSALRAPSLQGEEGTARAESGGRRGGESLSPSPRRRERWSEGVHEMVIAENSRKTTRFIRYPRRCIFDAVSASFVR
jgi:hypothetical protein